MLVVLPVFLALRRTRFWIPWLLVASYFFYGWWNPYYLILVVYSTALDYLLVALMDHCPRVDSGPRASSPGLELPSDIGESQAGRGRPRSLQAAFIISTVIVLALVATAVVGPPTLRPTLLLLGGLVLLMAVGAWLGSRRIWLLISLINNLT